MNNIDISVKLCGLDMKNPIIAASGTFNFGQEFKEFININSLGGISTKGTTLEPRPGNRLPRICESKGGMLNTVGLHNPGLKTVVESEIPALRSTYDGIILANVGGASIEDYIEVSEGMDKCEGADIIEVNISCPNVQCGGMAFGTDPSVVEKITRGIKDRVKKPVMMKLTPNVTDIVSVAKACEEGGADAVSLVNTFLAMRIDVKTGRPILSTGYGGLSGGGIFPIALRMVHQVAGAVSIPVVGIGGIETVDNILEMIMAGASCVQIGAANLVDPTICEKLVEKLPERMDELGYKSLDDIRGVSLK